MLVGNPTLLGELLIEVAAPRPHAGEAAADGVRRRAGAADAQARLRDEWQLPLVESYGQSELGGFVALGDPVLVPEEKFGAAGRPLPDKEVRILDADGEECPIGEVGEVCLRGGFMKGYWGKPDKTAEALRGGWLHSGDAGVMDARRLHHHARPVRRADQGRRPHLVSARRRGGAVRAAGRQGSRGGRVAGRQARPAAGRLRDADG